GIRDFHVTGVQTCALPISALNYALEAGRTFGCAAIDRGQRPPVISAIMKYRFTDLARQLVIEAMDVLAGAGIMRGPRNRLAESRSEERRVGKEWSARARPR